MGRCLISWIYCLREGRCFIHFVFIFGSIPLFSNKKRLSAIFARFSRFSLYLWENKKCQVPKQELFRNLASFMTLHIRERLFQLYFGLLLSPDGIGLLPHRESI